MHYSSVGYSGVIFALAVIETFLNARPFIRVFGVVNVPTKLYPWLLLVGISIVMPGVSFVGHLCGLLVGFVYVHGGLRCLMPSTATLRRIESSDCAARLLALGGGFLSASVVLTPDAPPAWVGLHACARIGGSNARVARGAADEDSSDPLTVAARLADAARAWLIPVPRDSDVAVDDLEHGQGGASVRSVDASASGSGSAGGSAAGSRPRASEGEARVAAGKAAMARLTAAKEKVVAQKTRGWGGAAGGGNTGALGALKKMRSAQDAAAARIEAASESESLLAGFRPNLPAAPTALGGVSDPADELELQRALALSLKSGAEA